MQRLLPVKRYSGDDQTGVLERQEAALSAWIAESGGTVVDWVEDETVSGAVNLDQRKSLGKWLAPPLLYDWDVMVVTEQDRITRDDLHWWVFVGRLIEWGKRLVVLDDPGLDLSTPNGRMIAGIKATQAANYRLDVKKKLRNARAEFRKHQRWAGGHWPYGYRAVPIKGADGWRLVQDQTTSQLARELARRVIEGDSLRAIARDFNARGIPTGRDHQRATALLKPDEERQPPRGYKWDESTVRKILENPTIIGCATHKGELIRDDGLPVQWAEPIIAPEEFRKIQEILAQKASSQRGKRSNRSPLLGVVYCACGQPMYHMVNNGYKYYRCATTWQVKVPTCDHSVNWPEAQVQDWLEDRFLFELGDEEIQDKEFIPGKDNAAEITSLKDAIDNLSGSLANLPPNSRAANTIIEKIAGFEQTLDKLEAEPVTPSAWKIKGTGVTYAEKWRDTPDWHKRGEWLNKCGIRAIFGGHPKRTPDVQLYTPEDLVIRAHDAVAGGRNDVVFMADVDSAVKQITHSP